MIHMYQVLLVPRVAAEGYHMFFKLLKQTDGKFVIVDVAIISKKVIQIESVRVVIS